MPENVKAIKERMVATKKTMQITSAMNMVSTAKMRQAEKNIRDYAKYMENVTRIVNNVLSTNKEVKLSILEKREIKNVLAILITSDRGLAGAYNANVIKSFYEDMNSNKDLHYICLPIGAKAQSAVKKMDCEVIDAKLPCKDEVDIIDVNKIILEAVKLYNDATVDQVVVYYNHYVNTITQVIDKKQILPFENNKEDEIASDYEIDQDYESLVEVLLPLYFENVVYGLLLDAKASEHASRMTAMKSATDNATEVIAELEIHYNRARQGQITTELIDIISGSNAQN